MYLQILRRMPIACVDVAIVSEGAALLVRRKDAPARHQWWLPGGRVRKGERLRQAAARKAREETGVRCTIGALLLTEDTIFPDGPGGIAVHSINSCFLAQPARASFRIELDAHHLAHRWVRAIPRGVHPYVELCLRRAGLKAARARR